MSVQLLGYELCRYSLLNGYGTCNLKQYIKTQSVPRSKHTPSVIQTIQSTLYSAITAVCSQIDTKHTNTLCGQNVELLNVKLAVHIVTAGLKC
jgi:hypothetical protein